jgi:3-deoxy-manno-octulosonate cytidylyltransferase (CMP-KDO synthetase)
MNIAIVIPARLDSTRIKEKMLIEFDGEPLIRLVYDKCRTMGYDTYVATDSTRISEHITIGNVIMTGNHENGTSRISEAVKYIQNYDAIINVQGDMLDITARSIKPIVKACGKHLNKGWANKVITAYKKGYDPDGVKIIHQNEKACWFTRYDIGYGDQHLGIYAYKPSFLKKYHLLKSNDPENLEQNRILNYYDIIPIQIEYDGKEINTKEDINSWSLRD